MKKLTACLLCLILLASLAVGCAAKRSDVPDAPPESPRETVVTPRAAETPAPGTADQPAY